MSKKLSFDTTKVSQSTLVYWETVLRLIDVASMYWSKQRLLSNYRDDATRFKVEGVMAKYYGGSEYALMRRVKDIQDSFSTIAIRLNAECKKHSLPKISKPMVLLELLAENERKSYFKREAKRLLSQNKVIALQTLEERYLAKKAKKQAEREGG